MPVEVTLTFVRPPGFEGLTHEEFVARVREGVARVEEDAAAARQRNGRRVLGRKGVLSQSWHGRPTTREARRGLDPRVAARDRWRRIEAILRNRAFVETYRAARKALLASLGEVVFPAGTYWLSRFRAVVCQPLAGLAPSG